MKGARSAQSRPYWIRYVVAFCAAEKLKWAKDNVLVACVCSLAPGLIAAIISAAISDHKWRAATYATLLTYGGYKYIFWDGASKPTSAVGMWQADLREVMQKAGIWIKGNLSHRFRDTAVDFWLGEGCDMTEVAAMLGDTVAVCERHYANLASKRMEERLSKMPTRSWSAHV